MDIGGQGTNAPDLLRRLAEASRKEEGNLRFDVLQHAMRANHFTVLEAWQSQKALDAHAAAAHTKQYRDALDFLSTQSGLLGTIFKEAECKIKDPAKLRRLIVDLIDREQWMALPAVGGGMNYGCWLLRFHELQNLDAAWNL